ncbi:hypothetical protein K435DRAFT_861919 [Dendrothele bispora CBS 962.96]|uniref:Uncharacterized protein n=1 Tax=Dendrothele bispora (strain CBS 962.96) TaxID=1314807 RepID=A0A4S8LUF9_DENBC|nr:hypothetical protein K435DRAFT_861919 [Dendrothele bispora CBS 962.96]
MAPADFKSQLKRELEDEEQFLAQSAKRTRREASSKAGIEIERYIGPGGYLDSQTTDTQYFDFSESQASGSSNLNLESQVDYGPRDDDLYQPESQSQDEQPQLEPCRSTKQVVVPDLSDFDLISPS